LDDVGPRPDGMQLDRINNDGHYEPGNVRWATALTQVNNREVTRLYTYQGQTQTLTEWARQSGIRYHTLYARLTRQGWRMGEALQTPA
jgi:hypothetical protein